MMRARDRLGAGGCVGHLDDDPGYLKLHRSGELHKRAAALARLADPCRLCPRACGARRSWGEVGFCGLGLTPVLASACDHHGEEPPLSGTMGAGTVFFAGCNLQCNFCQNHQISRDPGAGRESPAEALAEELLGLQERGCHNIELVTATPVIPAVVGALDLAAGRGLRLPLVYNSSGYERVAVLKLLQGVVDVYLPDIKFGCESSAARCTSATDYVERSRLAVLEMSRQVGPLQTGPDGIARRGLLVRHLVLPGGLSDTPSVLGFLAMELGTSTALSLMAQYSPPLELRPEPPLDRPLDPGEYSAALEHVTGWGFEEGWLQAPESRECYVPDFGRGGHPFDDHPTLAASSLTKGSAGRAK